MAQDPFKSPPDPKQCRGMTTNPQKSKKSSRVGQVSTRRGQYGLHTCVKVAACCHCQRLLVAPALAVPNQ